MSNGVGPGPKGRLVTSGNLLAHREAIRRQMEEEENLRKQAYYQALMEMGTRATNMLGMTTPRLPVLPDQIDVGGAGMAGPDPSAYP